MSRLLLGTFLLGCAGLAQEKAQETPDAVAAREQAQSYFEDDQASKAVATLTEAARLHPEDRIIGALLYSAIRDHVWPKTQTVPVRHKGPVRALAISPDGTKFATGSDYGEVFVSPTEPLEENEARARRVAIPEESDILGLAFTQDGFRLTVVSRGAALSIWEIAGAKKVFTGPRPVDGATAFAAVAKVDLAAVGTGSGEVQVYDTAAGRMVAKVQHPGGRVQALVLSRDGKKLAAAAGKTVRVWDVQSGQPIGPDLSHAAKIASVDFSYDGRYVLTGGDDQMAKLSDPEAGVPVLPILDCGSPVKKVSVSPDGSLIATLLDDASVVFWDAFTGQKLPVDLREDAPLNDFAWARTGLRAATVSEAGHATLWTVPTGRRRGETMPHVGSVLQLAWSADAKLLATGCLDGLARVWRTDAGLPLPTVRSHASRARTAFYSLDGLHLVTTSEDHTALHWRSGEVRPFGPALKHQGKVTCAVFDSAVTRILSCDDSGIAQLWDAATGKPDGASIKHPDPVNWVDFQPDGARFATAAGSTVSIWSVDKRDTPLAKIVHPGEAKAEMKCARFSPNGKWIATASTDGTARVWDAATWQPVGPPLDRGFPVLSVRFSPDSSRLVVTGEDAQAAVYDTATWKLVGTPVLAPGPVFSAAITADNRFLVLSSLLLDAVQFYEIASGRPLGTGLNIPSQATCVDYHLQDKVVVVACDDGTVRAVDSPFVTEDVPPWMCDFAEQIVGWKKTGPEEFKPVASYMGKLQAFVVGDERANEPDFARLARWKMTSGSQRHGMPRFVSTLASNIERRVDERSASALLECYEAVSGEPLILGALSLYLPNARQGEFVADVVLGMKDAEPLARCFAAGRLINSGRSAEAEQILAKALQDAPEDPRVLRRVAKLDARLLRTAQALELFKKAVRLGPNDFETRRSYAWVLYNFQRPAEAAAQFRVAQELGGEMIDDLVAGLCLCAAAQKDDPAARAAFERLVAIDPVWKEPDHLTGLRGWGAYELTELERIRSAAFSPK